MPNVIYNSFKRDVMLALLNLSTDTVNIMLVTATYVPNIDTHTKRSDVTNEVTGTGYTAGGKALAGKAVTLETATDQGKFTATNPVWNASSITARGAVVYKARGGAASADELIAYLDFGADFTSSSGDFTVQINASGLVLLG